MTGRTIQQYQVLEKLGEGGMGAVYKARDTRLDRTVALKFLSSDNFDSGEECAKLLEEARITAAINHPNVCSVLDIHQSESENFLVMEFVDGHNLRSEIDRGPLDLPRALAVAVQVAEGLRAAHKKSFIHRDIKPENILITAEGLVKVTDFGLARKADAVPAAEDGAGTVSYMSPEQFRGDAVDRTTDIWSLGVVMYEMIAGRRPFSGEYQQAVMYSILHEKPAPLKESRTGELTGFGKVIDRCLEKIPAVRYPDADALLADLKSVGRELEHPQEAVDRSIAVLPFTDLSSAGDNRYFSDGLTEEVIAGISRMKKVKVVSRTTVMHYDRSEKSAGKIAGDLGVQFLLEGSVRKRGSDLMITTRLVDALTDSTVWSEKYPGTMDDVFTIQETVAARIARALKVRLTPGEKKSLKRRPTESAEAYQLYLKGRYHWNKRNREGLETSIRFFERAIKKDKKYALAWAGLSDAYNLLCEYTPVSRMETYPKAKAAVDRAVELDPELAEARTSLASLNMLYELDWVNAEKEFRLSLYLKPGYATTHHWLAELLLYMGRQDEAVAEIDRALDLEPRSPAILRDKGMILYYVGRFDDAIATGKRTLELDRSFVTTHRLLSLAFSAKGDFASAVAENQLWGELTGNRAEAEIWLAYLRAASGDAAGARQLLASLPAAALSTGYQFRALGIVHATLGDDDAAFEWLGKALSARTESITSMKIDFKLERLRPDPRFGALLKKLGLEK
jgi:serine/threonine protein kinase/tetratricopeptide (TPR) repeat protein